MIVWEKDQPYFISDDKKGDCILSHFGLEYIDDIDIAGERFFVYFQKDESGWKAKAEINFTLETRGSFDIVEYVVSNKESDAYFSFSVCWIEKYRPTPPGISRLIH